MPRLLSLWCRCPVGLAVFLAVALIAAAATPERWLHVRIEKTDDQAEFLRVNVPLALAEKVLPAVHAGRMHEGKLTVQHVQVGGVDLRGILDAVRSLDDGEFLTIESNRQTVRVAKENGHLIARVREKGNGEERVDVKVPLVVVDALLSGDPDELNIAAALRVLSEKGEDTFVTVTSKDKTVRVWVDSQDTAE